MTNLRDEHDDPTSPFLDASLDIVYADQGDGTWAEIIYAGDYGALAGSDLIISQDGIPIRYRDMGDETWAEVVSVE